MKNKLFLICPASQMEPFLKEHYGQDSFFLSSLGAVFNFQEINYAEAIANLLEQESVEEIIIVNDISCRFIKSILEQEKGFGTQAERVMLDLFIENYSSIMAGADLTEKKKKLASLNIQHQALEILSNQLLLSKITQSRIKLKGLISAKAKGQLKVVNLRLQETYK